MNLRAALFRVLSDLKKNGDLGKETILRKSMLDDCKGEKFDELLAVFSTAVLRRVLTASIGGRQLNPALRLSLANGITPEEYQLVLPLLLAHRVSLGATGERRSRARGTFEKFSQLLDNKKVQLEQKFQENPQLVPEEPADFNHLAEQVKTNWLGSEEWANNLLYGRFRTSSDAFLELPFSKAWAKANESTVEELKTGDSRDLLFDLESRVSHQRDRLNRWREFSSSAEKSGRTASPSTNPTRNNSSLAFKDHQGLTVASISKAVREPGSRALRTQEDQLLSCMNEALARIDGKQRLSHVSPEATEDSPNPLPPQPSIPQETPTVTEPEPEAIPSFDNHEGDNEDNEVNPPEPSFQPDPTPKDQEDHQPDDPPPKPITLAERTRKSMSLIPPRTTQPPPPPQDDQERKRQARISFPINPFETPQKRGPTPQDELFDESADYASVFKSRPRIAQSPVASPAVHVSPLGEFDLGGVDADGVEGEGYSELGLGSPSVRRK